MKRMFVVCVFVMGTILISSSFASEIKSQPSQNASPEFKMTTKAKLDQLGQELEQLKRREKNLSPDKKESFGSAMTGLNEKWRQALLALGSLKTKPHKAEKTKILLMVSSLEKDLDKVESDLDDKHLGLGALLGF